MNLEGNRLSAHSIQHSQDTNVKKTKSVPRPPAGTHDSTKDLMFHLIETEMISPIPETSTERSPGWWRFRKGCPPDTYALDPKLVNQRKGKQKIKHLMSTELQPVLFRECETTSTTTKSLQSCPTLCDPTDCSLPGFSIHEILQARTLEWVAISFSNAWKWKVKVKSLSRVWLLATPWTAAYQAPPSMGFSGQQYWSGMPLPWVFS